VINCLGLGELATQKAVDKSGGGKQGFVKFPTGVFVQAGSALEELKSSENIMELVPTPEATN